MTIFRVLLGNQRIPRPRQRCLSSSSSSSNPLDRRRHVRISPWERSHLIFGSNTDVGKTLVSAGLVRAALQQPSPIESNSNSTVHYVKPLQTGGADHQFVEKHAQSILTTSTAPPTTAPTLTTQVLFQWQTPTSPHTACRMEGIPCSDDEIHEALQRVLVARSESAVSSVTLIETAGGVLSPAASSPANTSPKHALNRNSTSATSWGWITQADLYQPWIGTCPVVLVGDGKLGGISATLSALESLIVRGYEVAAIVMTESSNEQYDNLAALREYAHRPLALRGGNGQALFVDPEQSIVGLPPIPADPTVPLDEWFDSDAVHKTFRDLNQYLQLSWEGHVADLKALRGEGREVVWWPFTQHGNVETDAKVTLIDAATGNDFIVLADETKEERAGEDDGTAAASSSGPLQRQAQFDACASWWTQGLGHGESTLALAAAAAAGRYGHVIFPDVVHAPAVELSHKLLNTVGQGWADRVFFTDDGSTGMEVAIKMALKAYQTRLDMSDEEAKRWNWVCLAQLDSYHGDTLGVMNLAEPSVFNEGQHPWYEPKGLFLAPPTIGFKDGTLSISFPEGSEPQGDVSTEFASISDVMDVESRLFSQRRLYSQYKELMEMQWLVYEHSGVTRRIGCLVVEPILLGAGGMKFIDPLWQRALIDLAESKDVPIVFDEVAAGLHRVGVASCREILKKDPDVACYAKLLTGGLLPLSATLASEEVFESFLGDSKSQALLHGHSYTAHPVGCVSALHALETYEKVLTHNLENNQSKIKPPTVCMSFDEQEVRELSQLALVQQSFALGSVLAVTIEPEDGASGYSASSRTLPLVHALREEGVFARPLGNVIYIMASPLTSTERCSELLATLRGVLENATPVEQRTSLEQAIA